MVDPKTTGRAAVHSFRRGVAARVVDLLQDKDPGLLDTFVDVGVISRDFAQDTDGSNRVRTDAPRSPWSNASWNARSSAGRR